MIFRSVPRLLLLVCLCAWFTVFPGLKPVFAEDDIRLHLSYLPHRLTEDGDKQYARLIEELFAETDLKVVRQIAPLTRTTTLFKSDPGSCVFPANIVALDMGDRASEVMALETVDIVSLRLYTARENKVGAQLEDFAPERVGYIRGSGAIHLLGPDADRFLAINSEEQLISMLELGRLDAFLGHHPDTALALDDLGKPDALHANPLPFMNLQFPVSFICHDNAIGNRFKKAINPRIRAMRNSGRLMEILGPHADYEQREETEDTGPLIK